MKTKLYPMYFKPIYKDYIWGGNKISTFFNRNLHDGIYSESWEVSDHPDGMSVVKNGFLKGYTLNDIVNKYPKELIGYNTSKFPLLIKLIDAKDKLSVQVHPNNNNAHLTNGEPKTEMWYVIDTEPNAKIYAGLKKDITKDDFLNAIKNNSFEDVLQVFTPQKGDVFFIPGGRVHAIGEGCLLLEVQQNSNTTYRVYDWGRTDSNGKSRELHIDKALQVINFDDKENPLLKYNNSDDIIKLLECEFFKLHKYNLTNNCNIKTDDTFTVVFCESGTVNIIANNESNLLNAGETILIPACISEFAVSPNESSTIITIKQ